MSNSNNNNNNDDDSASTSDITDEILLSLLSSFPSCSTGNHSSQEKGRGKSHDYQDSIDGVDFFHHMGTNKRVKVSSATRDSSPSFYADLNDTSEPSHQDMARHNKFVEKRRQRTERHIVAHAEHLLSQAMQIEAELEAPQDQQDAEFVAVMNDEGSASVRRTFPSARTSERHHLAVFADIMNELDAEYMHDDDE